MNLNELIGSSSDEAVRETLLLLLQAHAAPVFGASKTIEHEVAAIRAFQRLGFLIEDLDEYELVIKLRAPRKTSAPL